MPIDVTEFAPGAIDNAETVQKNRAHRDRARAFGLSLFLIGVILMLFYRPFSQQEVGDSAGYDYIAQSILRGQLPYRDVVDMKTPGSMYLSAFAMTSGKIFGLSDVIAVRLFQILMLGLSCVLTFLVGRIYLRSTLAGLIAALLPLGSHKFAEWVVVGTQPKLPMIVFGLMTLLLIARRKPFWAGFSSMLSFLCWQPGLMFTGVAVLIFSRYLTSWRDRRALMTIVGALIPLGLTATYFYSVGALDDLWTWTITFNVSVFAPETKRDFLSALNHIWRTSRRVFGIESIEAVLALAGYLIFATERFRSRSERRDLFRDAVLMPPVIYFVFCIINMQSGPDLIPFVPFFGMFAGFFVVRTSRYFFKKPVNADRRPIRLDKFVPAAVIALLVLVAAAKAIAYRIPAGSTLQDQIARFQRIEQLIEPTDPIYVQGYAELLVVLKRPNLNPYIFFNQGIDSFVSRRRGVGFDAIIEEMEERKPRLVVLSRLRGVATRDQLQGWVDEHYERLGEFDFADVYFRKAR